MISPQEVNPFLLDMPYVLTLRPVRSINGLDVECPEADCVRVWGRINPQAAAGDMFDDITVLTRLKPDPLGRDAIRPYL